MKQDLTCKSKKRELVKKWAMHYTRTQFSNAEQALSSKDKSLKKKAELFFELIQLNETSGVNRKSFHTWRNLLPYFNG